MVKLSRKLTAAERRLAGVQVAQARLVEERTALRAHFYRRQIPDSDSDESDAEGSSSVKAGQAQALVERINTRVTHYNRLAEAGPSLAHHDQYDIDNRTDLNLTPVTITTSTPFSHDDFWRLFNRARQERQREEDKDDPESFRLSDCLEIADLPLKFGHLESEDDGFDSDGFIGRDELYEKLARRVRCPRTKARDWRTGSSGITSSRDNLERKGRGVIDRFAFREEDYKRVKRTNHATVTGPKSGLPHPTPDPRYNLPLPRTTGVISTTSTWSAVVEEEGRLELSRVNNYGEQEWLSAISVEAGEWTITKSVTNADEGPN